MAENAPVESECRDVADGVDDTLWIGGWSPNGEVKWARNTYLK